MDVVEEFKQPRGLDESSEFEQEVWQKYLTLKRETTGGSKPKPKPAALRGEGDGVAAQG